MVISGLQKTTLVDYPNKVACTVFTHGCNFRCPFCHNPELVTQPKKEEVISEEEFFEFLKKRKRLLDGVVITGGEPCLQKDLVAFCRKVKKEGFSLKIDTNGSFPEVLEELLRKKYVDYVAMDVKTGLDGYMEATGGFKDIDSVVRSIEVLRGSGIGYEFRTTVVKGLHKKEDIEKIGGLLKGSKDFSLQNFKAGETISKEFNKENEFSKNELEEFKKILEKYIENVILKNIY